MSNIVSRPKLEQLTTEILIYKQQTAQNIIEIGKRLIEVKEMLPHGEWGKWLVERVEFTDRTARRFMQAAREFSNWTSMSDLPPTKVFALLDVPVEEREEFIKQPHQLPNGEIKTVDEMTTRELQQAIKARKEAEARAERLQKALEQERERHRETQDIASNLERELEQERNKPPQVVEKEVIPEHIARKLKDDEREIQALIRRCQELEEQIKAAELNSTDGFDPKIQELKKKKLQQEADINTLELRVHIKNFLEKAAITSLLKGSLAMADPRTKKLLTESIEMLEKFTQEIKNALRSEMIIEDAQYKEVF